jgi:hypothetical protein
MNAIERHFRFITIQERIAQLESELLVMAEDLYGGESYWIERAGWHLKRASEVISSGNVPSTREDLTSILEVSIASVRERRRCEFIGNERVSVEAERPDTPISSPSLNRERTNLHNGE